MILFSFYIINDSDHFNFNNGEIIVRVDKRPQPSDDELYEEAEAKIPALPIKYYRKIENVAKQKYYANSSCAPFPDIYDIKHNSLYWQTLNSTNGTFYLYSAYYDTRIDVRPSIRILALVDRVDIELKTYFQIWIDNVTTPLLIPTTKYEYIWFKAWGSHINNHLQPYLIYAEMDPAYLNHNPVAVSLVENPCDKAVNCLKVHNSRPDEIKDIAVCVKGLDFLHADLSVKMIEWIELLRILGVDKIFLYKMHVHPNISKVLDYYHNSGFVQVTPLTLPGDLPNTPVLQHKYLQNHQSVKRKCELIPYNDCFYRNLYSYKYMIPLDIDEVIVPQREESLGQMVDRLKKSYFEAHNHHPDSLNFRNVYYLERYMSQEKYPEEIPDYMHMLRHIYRAKSVSSMHKYVKSILFLESVLTVHNHFPISCNNRLCLNYKVNPEEGLMQHYRKDCFDKLTSCENYRKEYIKDTSLWRYKDRLLPRVENTLKTLGFLDTY